MINYLTLGKMWNYVNSSTMMLLMQRKMRQDCILAMWYSRLIQLVRVTVSIFQNTVCIAMKNIRKRQKRLKSRKVIREASEHYSLRYTEVYAVECMYLRRCIARLTARIEELEKGNNTK